MPDLTLLQPFNLSTTGNFTFANTSVTGNLSSGNANLGNLVLANYFSGNGSLLTGIIASSATTAATVTTNAQPNITSVGTLASLTVTGNITSGNASLGNLVTATYFSGNGSLLTGLPSGYANSDVATFLASYGSNIISTTGNVTAGYFIGNGSTLSATAGANVNGNVTSAVQSHFANIANSVAGSNVSGQVGNALLAGTVYTNAQPNITSVGTLVSLSVTGNITSGNADLGNLATATYFSGNGSLLTGLPAGYANSNVAAYLPTYTGNVSANYFIGNGSTLTNITGSNVNGNVTSAVQSHYANIANSVAGSNISGQVGNALVAGTVYTNAQPNITSLGSLSALTVSGDATVTGNLTVGGNTTYINVETFRVEDPIIELGGGVNGAALTNNDGKDRGSLLHYYTTDVVDAFMGWDNSNGEFAFGSNVSVSSEVVTFNNFGNVRASYFIGNGSTLTYITGSNVNGNVTSAVQAHYANIANSVAGGNVSGQVGNALISGTVYTNAQPNITSVGSLSGLTVSNATGVVNLVTTANVSLGAVANLHITGGADGQILTTDGAGNLEWVDNSPATVTYLANSIALTNGVYVTGNLYSVQVFGDYLEPDGVYTLTDGTGAAPAWIFDTDYISVTNFNRVVMNINYTAASGHTIYVQLYNYTTSFTLASGTVTTTSGTNIVTVSSTTNMAVGQTIKFGTSVGGLTAGTAYYIISIPTSGQLTVGTGTGSGTIVTLSTDSQTSTVIIQNWDNIGTYTGLGAYYAFALQVIDDAAYISSGIVKLRLFHSNQGSASHTTNIDYLALELSTQGPQGPRGPTGATGSTGATGNGVASGGTTGQVLIKNSGSNYDTTWSSSLTSLTTITATGNITSGNADLGNLATANYFSGNGIYISNITGSNVSGQVGNALISGTVYTNAQPNITSLGTLASLTVTGITTLGAVGNVRITGGTNGQLVQTDGSGNLNFVTPTGTTITVDNFTGDGSQTAFTLSTTPTTEAYTMVALAGTLQPRSIYSLSGAVLTFSSAPPATAPIEVTTFSTIMGFGSQAVTSVNSQTGAVVLTTDSITEGSTNLYFSNARARTAISATGSVSYSNSTGLISYTQGNTDTVTEGTTNLYFSNARARNAISSNGSGPISYSTSTGIIDLPITANITANVITATTFSGNVVSVNANLTVNTLTANSVVSGGSGTPTLQSATSIEFQAATVVRSSTSAFQFYNCNSTVRDAIAASNGYVIYNTTTSKLQAYAGSVWVDLH